MRIGIGSLYDWLRGGFAGLRGRRALLCMMMTSGRMVDMRQRVRRQRIITVVRRLRAGYDESNV